MKTATRPFVELPRTQHGSVEWLRARRQGIGSSEISTLMGLTEYGSEWTIWLDKTGRVPLGNIEENEDMFWGTKLEPVIREVACQRLGLTFELPGTLQSVERPHMLYSPDGVLSDGGNYEGKNTSWFLAKDWDGQVPDHAELQVNAGMYVTGATHTWVAGLIGGNRLKVHRVERNERLIELICAKCDDLWNNYVIPDVEPLPGGTKGDREAVNHLHPFVGGDTYVTRQQISALHAEYLAARDAEKAAKQRKDAAGNRIRRLMDGGTRLLVGDKEWVRLKGSQFQAAKFRDAHPDVHAKYLTNLALDTARLKSDHPDLYTAFQSTSLDLKEAA